MKRNYFVKPNEQYQACLNIAMARNSRMKSNFLLLFVCKAIGLTSLTSITSLTSETSVRIFNPMKSFFAFQMLMPNAVENAFCHVFSEATRLVEFRHAILQITCHHAVDPRTKDQQRICSTPYVAMLNPGVEMLLLFEHMKAASPPFV